MQARDGCNEYYSYLEPDSIGRGAKRRSIGGMDHVVDIDFLLGYLRQLLDKRPDLKVVITSATLAEQQKIIHSSGKSRRIVIASNVAETS